MDIKKILNEIYMIDSELKNHESDLEKIIIELTKQKPDVVIDRTFIKSLRKKIMSEEIINDDKIVTEKPSIFSFSNLVYSGVGAIVMLLIMIPFVMPDKGASIKNVITKGNQVQSKIIDKGNRAFGDLVASNATETASKAEQDGANAAATTPAPLANPSISSRTMGMGGGGGTFLGDEAKMIAPYFPSYQYKYVGEELVLDGGVADVYKRVPGSGFNISLDSVMSTLDVGPISLSKLVSPKLDSFSLVEDRDFGLQVFVNTSEGSIDFNQNWKKWQTHFPVCADEACWEQNRMKISEMPGDDAIIAIAQEFIGNYGIDLNTYGEPMVRDDWRDMYERSVDKNTVWIPEDVQVIYPLIVNGETVYDIGGYPMGVSVNVNVKHMKVSGMYSYRVNDFEKSSYELETDKDRIIKLAEAGGSRQIYYAEGDLAGDQKVDIVELGTPKKVLLSYQHFDKTTEQSVELFVPALVFPIQKLPANAQYFYESSVVIPLVKEILDNGGYGSGFDGGPMPLIKEGGGSASGGAADGELMTTDAVEPEIISNEEIKTREKVIE